MPVEAVKTPSCLPCCISFLSFMAGFRWVVESVDNELLSKDNGVFLPTNAVVVMSNALCAARDGARIGLDSARVYRRLNAVFL